MSYESDDSTEPIPVVPEVTVKYTGKPVTETSIGSSEDGYYVTYESNDCVGTGYVCVTGTGKFSGTRRMAFKINAKPLSKATITKPATNITFTGKEIRQDGYELRYGVTKTFEGTVLKEGRDYTVSYANNINAGNKAAIIYTGRGIYSGTVKKTYTIKSVQFKEGKYQNNKITTYLNYYSTYEKGGNKPSVELVYTDDGERYSLVQGKDYTLRYSGNTRVNASSGPKKVSTVTVTGKGNFKGTLSLSFKVATAKLENTQMTASDVVYTGKAGKWKPTITLYDTNGRKLAAGTDYDTRNITYSYEVDGEVKEATNDTVLEAGTEVIATVTGKGNYTGSRSAPFRVVGASIAKAAVKVNNKEYIGRSITLTKEDIISVKLGKEFLEPGDFEIVEGSYVNNKNTGTAKVTIRGVGNYGGTKVVTFKITKRKFK